MSASIHCRSGDRAGAAVRAMWAAAAALAETAAAKAKAPADLARVAELQVRSARPVGPAPVAATRVALEAPAAFRHSYRQRPRTRAVTWRAQARSWLGPAVQDR